MNETQQQLSQNTYNSEQRHCCKAQRFTLKKLLKTSTVVIVTSACRQAADKGSSVSAAVKSSGI